MKVSKLGFKAALATTSKDATRYALNGVYVEPDGRVVATDGHRLVTFHESDTFGERPGRDGGGILVPVDAVKELVKLGGRGSPDVVELEPGDDGSGQYVATCAGASFRFKPEGVEYPDWRHVIPKNRAEGFRLNAKYLRDMADSALKAGADFVDVLPAADASRWAFEAVVFTGDADGATFTGVIMPVRK